MCQKQKDKIKKEKYVGMATENIKELLDSAKNYFEIGDYEHAGALYTKISEMDSGNWRGVFFSVYCAARTCTIAEIPKYIDILVKCSKSIPPMICEMKYQTK